MWKLLNYGTKHWKALCDMNMDTGAMRLDKKCGRYFQDSTPKRMTHQTTQKSHYQKFSDFKRGKKFPLHHKGKRDPISSYRS